MNKEGKKAYRVRGAEDIALKPCKGQKRLYANERDALMALAVIANIAGEHFEPLAERAELVKGLKADMGMLRYQSMNVFNQILQTVQNEQLSSLVRNLHDSTYTTGVKSPNKKRDKDFGMWVSFEDCEVICKAIRESVCLVCTNECSCQLRKVLDRLGTDVEHDGAHCGYRMI